MPENKFSRMSCFKNLVIKESKSFSSNKVSNGFVFWILNTNTSKEFALKLGYFTFLKINVNKSEIGNSYIYKRNLPPPKKNSTSFVLKFL